MKGVIFPFKGKWHFYLGAFVANFYKGIIIFFQQNTIFTIEF